jgi:SAM-dependent methyltransferase
MPNGPSSNSTYNRDFANYYDRLNGHKDYAGEVSKLDEFIRTNVESLRPSILDVGCGTGQHAMLLATKGYDITAVDVSPDMIRVAKCKTDEVQFCCAEVSQLRRADFEFAYSLFNVINCFNSISELTAFFEGIANRLLANATLLVESWNPIAVIAAPPTVVERIYEYEDQRIVRKVTPFPDFFRQRLELEYNVDVYEAGAGSAKLRNFKVVHKLLLFTPQEIEYCLQQGGFRDIKVYTALPELTRATANDRMLAFACKRAVREQ